MAAVKLVLNFKAEAYAARRILVNDSWARLTDPAFPKEVLILVVEAAVRCQAPFLSIELSSDSLESIANHIFARWQDIMDHETWGLLQQMTVRALLQHSIIRTTTGFNMANTLRFPPAIEGRERFIRFLALDLKIMPTHGTHHFQLTKSCQAMQSTKLLLPNLETCIIAYDFLHIGYDDVDLFFDDMPDVIEAILTISNVKNVDHVTTLGTTILESLAAFRKHGPGRRKFVRFCHSDCDAIDFHHGPLVRIDGDVQVSNGEASTEDSAGEEDTAIKVAKRIFEKAYWHDPQWRGSS